MVQIDMDKPKQASEIVPPPTLVQPTIISVPMPVVPPVAPAPVMQAAPPVAAPAPPPPVAARSAQSGQAREDFVARLLAQLNRFKQYPAAARKAHIQGVVMLHFVMDARGRVLRADIAKSSGRPVLVVPYAGSFASVGRRALVSWDAGTSATRALTASIPLLRRAEIVEVAVFNADPQTDVHGEQPGADIALYLARHGLKVDVIRQKTQVDIGNALLSLATDLGSDLVVMGGYGHSRFREILLGGVTRTVLESMTVPVLMAH